MQAPASLRGAKLAASLSASIRPPAVSGLFYDADPAALRRTVTSFLPASASAPLPERSWRAVLLPHAGHRYSGRVCGVGVGHGAWPKTILILGPNHHGVGAEASLSNATAWRTPLGDVPIAKPLVDALRTSSRRIELDALAHAREHAIEVILPFLQVVRPDAEVACLSLGAADVSLCAEVGAAVAATIKDVESKGERVAIVVSSDFSHYLPKATNWKQDERAIDAVLAGDPGELFDRVLRRERISMCGILPATALLFALKDLPRSEPTLLAHADSSDAGGDASAVVGYAAIGWRESAPS